MSYRLQSPKKLGTKKQCETDSVSVFISQRASCLTFPSAGLPTPTRGLTDNSKIFILFASCISTHCVMQLEVLTSDARNFDQEMIFRLHDVVPCAPSNQSSSPRTSH